MRQTQIQTSASARPPLFKNYQTTPGVFDEYLDANQKVRPHWQGIASQFERIPSGTWNERKNKLDKLIRDYGVTYDLYSEDSGKRANWALDMLPNCLQESELQKIETMLSQRALLLNLTLQDIYGRQTLLKGAKIDPYLIFANPGYLRPCHGLIGPKQKHIHIYAADIARSPSGDWWVISDRLESGAGLGYALEHRALMSRVFPVIMAESGTKSLQPFLSDFCRYIDSLSPAYVDSPRIALLSSGPQHPNYFEQSFLARNLGFHLVEGADLTVRNNRLYMKTVRGVQGIDVLLRRVNSAWCDPLELHNHSLLGVPGMVNAIRHGNLTVANGLGSGVAESTALTAFLPSLSRSLLGETLECPSVATWWCGHKRERDYVIEHIDELVIKPTFRSPNAPTYFGPNLSAAERADLIARINQNPQQFCGQEILSHATIPTLNGDHLAPRNYVMRVLMIPSGEGWKIMPGGLVRYSDEEQHISTSLERGGKSKDTWVLRNSPRAASAADDPPEESSPVVASLKRNKRIKDDLPSRTADNMFWLGRYLERSESLTRLLKTLSSFLVNQSSATTLLPALPFITQTPKKIDPNDFQLAPEHIAPLLPEIESRILTAIYDVNSGVSLLGNLAAAERAASHVKERLSSDTWLQLLAVCQIGRTNEGRPTVYDDSVVQSLDAILGSLSGFIGTLTESMTRSLGWMFLQIGRRVERTLAIARLLHDSFQSLQIEHDELLESLLTWADSSITYRRIFLNTMHPTSVLDVICFDETNPRSLAYQAKDLQNLLYQLPHHQSTQRHPIDQCALRLSSRIGLSDSETLINNFKLGSSKSIEFFEGIIEDLGALNTEFDKTYFAHTASAEKHSRPISN